MRNSLILINDKQWTQRRRRDKSAWVARDDGKKSNSHPKWSGPRGRYIKEKSADHTLSKQVREGRASRNRTGPKEKRAHFFFGVSAGERHLLGGMEAREKKKKKKEGLSPDLWCATSCTNAAQGIHTRGSRILTFSPFRLLSR